MFDKVFNLIIVAAYVVAFLSGIGQTLYAKAYEVTVFIVILGAIGFPTFLRNWKQLIDK